MAQSAVIMQRSIWFARRRHFRDNLSAKSACVACSCSSTSQPTPASHFLASHGWPELSTRRREAGIACLSIAASRPKLHVQEHSPLNGRCQVAVGLQFGRSFLRRDEPRAHARRFGLVDRSLAKCGPWFGGAIRRHRFRTKVSSDTSLDRPILVR